jgi:hypothetical protein
MINTSPVQRVEKNGMQQWIWNVQASRRTTIKGKTKYEKKEREGTPAVKAELGRPLKLVVL